MSKFEFLDGSGDRALKDDEKMVRDLKQKLEEAAKKHDDVEVRRCYGLIQRIKEVKNNPKEN